MISCVDGLPSIKIIKVINKNNNNNNNKTYILKSVTTQTLKTSLIGYRGKIIIKLVPSWPRQWTRSYVSWMD